ncbi:hypothetical protein GCM10011428_84090 [Streptomyces violaceus]
MVSLHRASDPTGLSAAGTEAGLHRRFTTPAAGTYEVKASAVPVPGEELDRLLYEVAPEQQTRIVATADSTASLGAGLTARNLTDGDLTTAWIAGDRPAIHLSWEGKQAVGELVLAPAGGLSSRASQVHISSPDGATIAGVDENGWVRFPPITTDRLDITVTETAPLTLHNPVADEDLRLPVGLTEAYLPALDQYRTPQPDGTRKFSLPCGKGPDVALDGELYQTSVKGTVRDLVERRGVEVTLCQEGRGDSEVRLPAGEHRLEGGDAGPLALTDVTLTRGTVPEAAAAGRELEIRDWLGDRREVTVGSGAASYFTTYENFNDGWKATLNGKELTPVRLDGWQQGWRVPAGAGGAVKLSYEPATTYDAGLIGSGAGIAVLLGLALWRRRAPNPDAPQPVPPLPGLWLGTVALTLVGAVIAGWLALLVPVLALLASRRHALLVPIAFVALAGAGVAAAIGGRGAGGRGRGGVRPSCPTAGTDRTVRGPGEPARARPGEDRARMTRPTRIPFPVVDEVSRHCLQEEEPETVHIEVHLPGPLDEPRLRKAFTEALHRHPRILMREAEGPWFRRRYEWELTGEPDTEVVTFTPAGPRALQDARTRALAEAPPCRCRRRYGSRWWDQSSSSPSTTPPSTARPASAYSPLPQSSTAAGTTTPPHPRPAPRNPHKSPRTPRPPGHPRAGSARHARPLPGNGMLVTELPLPHRPKGSPYTVNDQLMVTTALTIAHWNREHGARPRPLRITMPVDDRPRDTTMPIGNGTRLVEVPFAPGELKAEMPTLLRRTSERTRALKALPRPQLGHGAALLTTPWAPVAARRRPHPRPAQGRRPLDVDDPAQQHRPHPVPAGLRRGGGPRARGLVLGPGPDAARPDRHHRLHGRPPPPRPALVPGPAQPRRRRPPPRPLRALSAHHGGDLVTPTTTTTTTPHPHPAACATSTRTPPSRWRQAPRAASARPACWHGPWGRPPTAPAPSSTSAAATAPPPPPPRPSCPATASSASTGPRTPSDAPAPASRTRSAANSPTAGCRSGPSRPTPCCSAR